MNPTSIMLIFAGIALIFFGLIVNGSLGPLGRLPGDIHVQRQNFSFYFPLATSILLSIILTAIFWIIHKIQ